MKNYKLFGILILITLCSDVGYTQDILTQVEGDVEIIGKIELHEKLDTSIVIIGYKAGRESQTIVSGGGDIRTTLVGSNSGEHLVDGSNNSIYGYGAARFSELMHSNSFFGSQAGQRSGGDSNSFFGAFSGLENENTTRNSFFGANSGQRNTTGSSNAFFGYAAGSNNSSASDNTFIGGLAGIWNRLGERNTFVGAVSGIPLALPDVNNAIGLGYASTVECDFCAAIGGEGPFAVKVGIGESSPSSVLHLVQQQPNSSGGVRLTLPGAGSWNMYLNDDRMLNFALDGNRLGFIDDTSGDYMATSDARLKENIRRVETVLDNVLALEPVYYTYKRNLSDKPETLGFLAQDVEKLFPSVVSDSKEGLGISYAKIGVIAVKAIQEQQNIILEQRALIESLSERLTNTEEELKKLSDR